MVVVPPSMGQSSGTVEDLNPTEFLTRPLLLCFTSINVMHTSGANANVILVQRTAAPRPSMRIIGFNACAGREA